MIASACVTPLLLAFLLSCDDQPAPPKLNSHLDQNALYRELLTARAGMPALPEPSLEDGLNPQEQNAAIAALPGLRVPLPQFLRNAVSSPFHMNIGEINAPAVGPRLRPIDLWFAAFGNIDAILKDDKGFNLFPNNGNQVTLSVPDLAKRGIAAPAPNVKFIHASFDVLEQVRLDVTLRTEWSRTPDSILTAATIDPRFTGDAEFPNTWRPIIKGPNGTIQLGDPRPYTIQSFYLKATRLAMPAGAFLVEYHVQFEHPKEWFKGNDHILTSKLPIAVQGGVRTFRQQIPRQNVNVR